MIKTSLELDLEGRRAIVSLARIEGDSRTAIRAAFYRLGSDLKMFTQKIIRDKSNKTGRFYIRRTAKRRFRHQASAPGEAPANRSGNLARSIEFKVRGGDELEFGPSDAVKYGKYLELGTKNMARRPYLETAVKEKQAVARQYMETELQKALRP